MNYGEIFSKSWKTIWKHKILWVFGIFAAMLEGGWYNPSNNNTRGDVNYTFSGDEWSRMFPRFGYNIQQFADNINEGTWIPVVIALLCLGLIWFILSLFLGTVGKAALIKGVVQVDEDEHTKLKFGPLFKEGLGYFWQLFVLRLLTIGAVFAAFLVGIVFSIVTLGIGALLLLCLALPISIAVGMLLRQTKIFIVAEDMPMIEAIKASWKFVFEENLGNYVLMILIVGVGGWILSLIISVPIFLVLIPVTVGLIISEGSIMGAGLILGIIVFFLVYIPFAIIANGFLTAYIQSVWTLTYRELRQMPKESDLTPLELQSSLPDDGEMD